MKTLLRFSCFSLVLLCSISCQQEKPKHNTLSGVWESLGSGWVLQIQDSTYYKMYDVTSVACLTSREAPLEELKDALSLKNDTLFLKRGVMTYQFVRSTNMPSICDMKISEEKRNDPLYNFEVFAQTVKDHYAFMELNAIDWERLYTKQKTRLINNPTEKELYTILEETLELLKDNHAYLEATEAFYKTLETDEDEETNPKNDLVEYGDFQVADMVAKHFLVEDMTKDSWLIKWGEMEDNIGYIQIKAMWLYADLNIPQGLIKAYGYVDAYVKTFSEMDVGFYSNLEVKAVSDIMDRVMQDLGETNSIIVDVRFNGGGQDAITFELLKRFNTRKRHAVNTKLKMGTGFSPLLKLYIDEAEKPYAKPVYILTSPQTGSAAESFAIGSMALPNLKRIGSNTQGALSTALEKTLPNTWVFSISNEVYMDTQGNNYENIGVPPDMRIEYPEDRQDFFRSVANDLEGDMQAVLKIIDNQEK